MLSGLFEQLVPCCDCLVMKRLLMLRTVMKVFEICSGPTLFAIVMV